MAAAAGAPLVAAHPAPALALLKPVTWSPQIKFAMAVLMGYLGLSVLLLITKVVQLAAR